ncbi:UDP-N-acetylmuramyl pentapeptide synthase [Methanomicrobium sp. W14]|uniref:coenzyme F430 synthase n=1 Tax=Methanomicrobium sp. W14 TaxID=2817839 RepID=UPI001AE4B1F6|nr:coenzyme F430 synthase [Methanomicrobium sp. W14]MBP2132222.1 UDP-N-acetylmuramyl pentapeptide synthase [Methanomicrobium sp. W14]
MYILVLDTIHGGEEIALHLKKAGHKCDTVDVYRHEKGVSEEFALKQHYDLIIAPVHLNPGYSLLDSPGAPVITHHQAVSMIIGDRKPTLSVEITGARGKTTTAFALAHVLKGKGKGILHTSKGTFRIPEQEIIDNTSITPASAIFPALLAYEENRWLIAEESLGVCGFSTLCILTSSEDYKFAGNTKSALLEKVKTLEKCKNVLLAPGAGELPKNALHAEEFASVRDDVCTYEYEGVKGSFKNPLLRVKGYREAITTAAAAGCILGANSKKLEDFMPVEGRMSFSRTGGRLVVDNSNSGVNKMTAVTAASFAEKMTDKKEITLVIGVEKENICEGFSPEDVISAIRRIKPKKVVIVGDSLRCIKPEDIGCIPAEYEKSLEEGKFKALNNGSENSIVLCVKTWR